MKDRSYCDDETRIDEYSSVGFPVEHKPCDW